MQIEYIVYYIYLILSLFWLVLLHKLKIKDLIDYKTNLKTKKTKIDHYKIFLYKMWKFVRLAEEQPKTLHGKPKREMLGQILLVVAEVAILYIADFFPIVISLWICLANNRISHAIYFLTNL